MAFLSRVWLGALMVSAPVVAEHAAKNPTSESRAKAPVSTPTQKAEPEAALDPALQAEFASTLEQVGRAFGPREGELATSGPLASLGIEPQGPLQRSEAVGETSRRGVAWAESEIDKPEMKALTEKLAKSLHEIYSKEPGLAAEKLVIKTVPSEGGVRVVVEYPKAELLQAWGEKLHEVAVAPLAKQGAQRLVDNTAYHATVDSSDWYGSSAATDDSNAYLFSVSLRGADFP